MALQADGKIVMVGGTFTDFVMARFNADGSLDTSFGIGGKVTTDMGSGLRPEEGLAVAIQGDGKIVVAGYVGINGPGPNKVTTVFAIARYNSDGSLDTSFGTGGRVSGGVNGRARAVVIQPDGKIVLAGDFELELSNGTFVSDFTVARFNTNGSLDLAFGGTGSGQTATDIGQAFNTASNVVLQPDGAIVLSGKANCGQAACDHTDVVRYSANGLLDTSFGNGGKLTLAGKLVGEGLARQADGKLVLAGGVDGGRRADLLADAPERRRFDRHRLRQRRHGRHAPERKRDRERHRLAGRRQDRRRRHALVVAESELHRRALPTTDARRELRHATACCRSTSSASTTPARTCWCSPTARSSSADWRATTSMATAWRASILDASSRPPCAVTR